MVDNGGKCLHQLARLLPACNGCYIVGGAVRDCLLGNQPLDIDLVSGSDAQDLAARIARKFGTRVIHLRQNNHELFRVVTPVYTFDVTSMAGGGLEDDLAQRDFTVNAMAYDPATDSLIDIFDSRADLANSVVRMTSAAVLAADPLRLLRAFRLGACLSFTISEPTLDAIRRKASTICSVAGERVYGELFKLLNAPRSFSFIRQMNQTGLLTALFPELAALNLCLPDEHHAYNGLTHSIETYTKLEDCLDNPPDWLASWSPWLPAPGQALYPLLKLAALLHDIGKPPARKMPAPGAGTYPGHAVVGARMAVQIARRLRCSTFERKKLEFLVGHHMHLFYLFQLASQKRLSRRAVGRFFRISGDQAGCLLVLFTADTMAKTPERQRSIEALADFCHLLADRYLAASSRRRSLPRLITGYDLMEKFGLEPSPLFRTILEQVSELYLAGILTTRNQALKWVERYLENRQAANSG